MLKNIKTKPMVYVHFFQKMQQVAANCGYELLIHGSLNRDCDLVAVPWDEGCKDHTTLLHSLCEVLTGGDVNGLLSAKKLPHRWQYILPLNAATQFYLDIAVY